jgi:DNA-binding winged helix-turn-helix (wHTH) protein/TolB-like protein
MWSKEELFEGFTIGDWEVLPARGLLRQGDNEVHPEPKVFEVLMALAQRDGDLVTRDQLIEAVWDGRPTSDEPINRCLSQLRGHLNDRQRPHQYVETLQRRGYRLMQPVVLHAQTAEPSVPEVTGAVLRQWKIVAAVLAAGFLGTIVLSMREPAIEPPIRSVAILPIENLSGDPANQYIVDGIKNVLAGRLAEIPDLRIKNTRVNYDMEPSEIAIQLDVDTVLTSAVQLQGETLKVTYLISRGRDNVTIGSGEVNGNVDGIFALQQRLAKSIHADLSGASAPQLITRYTPDSVAYNSYMRGMYALEHRGESDNLENAITLFQESIGRDRFFGPAYLSLATAYALLPRYRNAPVAETNRLAVQTVEMGVAVDANIGDAAGAIYGSVYHQQKRWAESEAAYLQAISADVVDSNAFNWYSRMLASVGRLDDALTQALAAVAIDPDNAVNNSRVAITYTWLGMSDKAHEYFRRSDDLGLVYPTHQLARALLLFREGRIDEARDVAIAATGMDGDHAEWVDPVFAAFADPLQVDAALSVLQETTDGSSIEPTVEVIARTLFGDIDGAMAIARRLQGVGELFEMDLLYIPELQPLREHPDFMPLLKSLGVIDYWSQADCQWTGTKATCTSH